MLAVPVASGASVSYKLGVSITDVQPRFVRVGACVCVWPVDGLCSASQCEAAQKASSLAIMHLDPSTNCSKLTPPIVSHTPDVFCWSAVQVALGTGSGASVQLKAAVTVEVLDYIMQSNWKPEVGVVYTVMDTLQLQCIVITNRAPTPTGPLPCHQ
jgi:hypothetical protein